MAGHTYYIAFIRETPTGAEYCGRCLNLDYGLDTPKNMEKFFQMMESKGSRNLVLLYLRHLGKEKELAAGEYIYYVTCVKEVPWGMVFDARCFRLGYTGLQPGHNRGHGKVLSGAGRHRL